MVLEDPKTLKMKQSEKEIENSILEFLKIIGVYCWKNQSVGIYDQAKKIYRKPNSRHHLNGVSDILGIIQGRFLAIEVKSATGSLTGEQRIFLARVNENGGIAFVARSVEQAAESLLKHFPNNENLKKFTKEYISQGSTCDH